MGAVDGPEPSALSALSAESFDSAAAGAVAVASRLTAAAAAAVPAAPLVRATPDATLVSEGQSRPLGSQSAVQYKILQLSCFPCSCLAPLWASM